MLLTVGSGVGYGAYVNQAWAINTLVNSPVSNVAAATVRVTPDPTLDCTDIIGKVFDDVNANGYEDEGEPGLPNVRLVTPRGWLINTDAQGRFHIACAIVPNQDRGSNFVMKLDEKTLPTGYRVTTENPASIRATSGKFARLDFGAALFRVFRLDLSNAAFRAVKTPKPEAEPEVAWDIVIDSATIPPLRFNVAKFAITDEHLALIHDALVRVQTMQNVRNVKLQVVGHTDSTPIVGTLQQTIPDNWALSRSRASATAVLLREKLGLAANMIVVDGEADTQPLASNATPEGRALNRRVEIQVIYQKKTVHEPTAVIASTSAAGGSTWVSWETDERPPWRRAVDRLMNGLEDKPSVLRLGYCRGPGEKIEEARFRVWQVSKEVKRLWTSKPGRYALTIEEEIDGSACAGNSP
jgi:outer membrane protein OmpA-like peptidoglycan-associated protein